MAKVSVASQIRKFIEKSAIAEVFDKDMEKDMAYEYLAIAHNYSNSVIEDYKTAKEYCSRGFTYNFTYKKVSEFFYTLSRYFACGGDAYKAEDYLRTVTCHDDYNIQLVLEAYRRKYF